MDLNSVKVSVAGSNRNAPPGAAVVDVEPDDAVRVPSHAVGLRGETVHRRDLEQLDLAGLAIDLADGGASVRDVAGKPELAVEIEPGVMHAPARDEDGRRAERPIAAVVLHEVARQARVRIERHVVLLEHDARRLPGGTRIGGKSHSAFAGSARARETGRQFLLMVVENAGRLALVPHERAVDVGILHQLDDGVPAGLVESVLKRVARGVTAGANIAHEPFHALVLLGLLGQRRQHDVAWQLPNEILRRRENETLLARRGQIDVGFGGLEAYRLRPDPVLSAWQRWKIVVAARIGEDGR